MEGLSDNKFRNLTQRWTKLGVGYAVSVPSGLVVHPEETLVETLPHLFEDFHLFGLVIACLSKFHDCFLPGDIPPLLETTFKDVPDSSITKTRAYFALWLIAKKLAKRDSRWNEISIFCESIVNSSTAASISRGEIRLWGEASDPEIRMMLRLCPADPDLEALGVRIPEASAAPDKKLRDRDRTISENPIYQSRLR